MNSTCNVTDTTFTGNTAQNSGGAIFLNRSTLYMDDSHLDYNYASMQYSKTFSLLHLYFWKHSPFHYYLFFFFFSSSFFLHWYFVKLENGGAIFALNSTIGSNFVWFIANLAETAGGGIFIQNQKLNNKEKNTSKI